MKKIILFLIASLTILTLPMASFAQSVDCDEGPTTPNGVTATAVSGSKVNLTWNPARDNVGVTNYNVYRDGSLITTLGNVLVYSDTTVSQLTTYYYRIQALDGCGNGSGLSGPPPSGVDVTTTANPPPSPKHIQKGGKFRIKGGKFSIK